MRAVSSAYVVTLGTIGGIVATCVPFSSPDNYFQLCMLTNLNSFTYVASDGPAYPIGHSINLGGQIAVFFLSIFGILYCMWENKMRRSGKRDHRLEGLSAHEARDLGYRHPDFKYIT